MFSLWFASGVKYNLLYHQIFIELPIPFYSVFLKWKRHLRKETSEQHSIQTSRLVMTAPDTNSGEPVDLWRIMILLQVAVLMEP